ncbi:hypothetical protein CYMTET_18636 [Cymbomonas tetramitiformis]|uniref:Uncharacterized protein n=1 Tax=Cymbomonas tetramitiformis TaxID=36881 RepID=A0AAE0L5Z2_9CHLO|nr:hypothetical protein CYMTET_18636 [Cymbomonas tetramitiformis]
MKKLHAERNIADAEEEVDRTSRVLEDEEEYDSEGFLLRPKRQKTEEPSTFEVVEDEEEYDSEGFLLKPVVHKQRSDEERFEKPYQHVVKGADGEVQLSIEQQPFSPEGFASTVWDSSIVMSKYMERWRENFTGKRCLELGAGCGLVGECAPMHSLQ